VAKKKKKEQERYKDIRNAKARRNYFIEDTFEAGIALKGTEVKSIRQGRAQVNDAFVRPEKGELFLCNAHIDEYTHGTDNNHPPRRPRKLLLHKSEIEKLIARMERGGMALIPLRLYFKGSLVKVELGLGKGKKLYDKRDDLKKKTQDREIDRAMADRHNR